ncbi:hypothetical protein [Rhizobium lentis]|uniref:Uncharacterized protein n=1 Tax=Rhizobium lentis TaxID=1138194 RepID=A0A7W8ULA1_9HYPH|nr:hypothetical protein [Rhizobium lentis]MBB4573957.1 hypothetical protein [Rhizobium lentis]MBB5549885.1 hypothetical protein [Rhizobium lentis]MBB5560107.1 hypothetical protein [Rhizobium lentis]MBB5567005.1 hypothetical protein [Rhizobium lentis]
MIRFVNKAGPQPPAEEAGGNGCKEIQAAADRHGKANNAPARRRTASAPDDGRLI